MKTNNVILKEPRKSVWMDVCKRCMIGTNFDYRDYENNTIPDDNQGGVLSLKRDNFNVNFAFFQAFMGDHGITNYSFVYNFGSWNGMKKKVFHLKCNLEPSIYFMAFAQYKIDYPSKEEMEYYQEVYTEYPNNNVLIQILNDPEKIFNNGFLYSPKLHQEFIPIVLYSTTPVSFEDVFDTLKQLEQHLLYLINLNGKKADEIGSCIIIEKTQTKFLIGLKVCPFLYEIITNRYIIEKYKAKPKERRTKRDWKKKNGRWILKEATK